MLHYLTLQIIVTSSTTEVNMKKEIKSMLHSQNQLEEILGVSRVQAWRIWNGKSALTEANERLIKITIDSVIDKMNEAESIINEWIESQKGRSNGEFYSVRTKAAYTVGASVSFVDCDETNSYIKELIKMTDEAEHDSTRDVLLDAYFIELSHWKFSETEVKYK